MRDDRPGDLHADPPAHSPTIDDTTLALLRRLLTLPDAEVDRLRAATRKPPRDQQSGPSADYRDE